jgi:prepilin-type N-terminal cleavage/methylation domain-containing protein
MNAGQPNHKDSGQPTIRRGFTLLEMLVAIGAIAVLTVGIASVFSAIGKTVSGGRRISQLTALSAQIETVMRQDFARMSREGFLMVRNQLTNTGGPRGGPRRVSLNAVDPNPARTRRVDEILFFAKGEFTSSREPASAAYRATAQAARIYYGHGTRRPENTAPAPPALVDYNNGSGRLGQANTPNLYAGDWTLVRHQALLVDPRDTMVTDKIAGGPELTPVLGLNPTNPAVRYRMADKEGQVALQPAGLSVFRRLAPLYQSPLPPSVTIPPINDASVVLRTGTRRMSSGLVDIVTQTLPDIRDIVECARGLPSAMTNTASWYNIVSPDPAASSIQLDGNTNPAYPVATRMQAWMDDAWPAPSDAVRASFEPLLSSYNGVAVQVPTGGRIRVEPSPVFLREALRGDPNFTSGDNRVAADYRIDQLQLANNAFIRSCSEFIVEWSFGEADPTTNQVVWYGLTRREDRPPLGVPSADEPLLARPFPYRVAVDAAMPPFTFPYVNAQGQTVRGKTTDWASDSPSGFSVQDRVTPQLIYGANFFPNNVGVADGALILTSYFGFTDPTGAGSRPWAWPEFVRITLRVVDPQDATTEQTFQYVFKTPGNGAGKV